MRRGMSSLSRSGEEDGDIGVGLFSHSQKSATGKLSLDLGCRGFWDSGKKCGTGGSKTLSTGAPSKPHLHMVHHHLIGQVAAVLGLIHLFV